MRNVGQSSTQLAAGLGATRRAAPAGGAGWGLRARHASLVGQKERVRERGAAALAGAGGLSRLADGPALESIVLQLRELVPPSRHDGCGSGAGHNHGGGGAHHDPHDVKRPKHVVLSDTIAMVKELQERVRLGGGGGGSRSWAQFVEQGGLWDGWVGIVRAVVGCCSLLASGTWGGGHLTGAAASRPTAAQDRARWEVVQCTSRPFAAGLAPCPHTLP